MLNSADVITPLLHVNGTSPSGLLDPLREASLKGREFMRALESSYPHPRDYDVSGPSAYQQARQAHTLRLNKVSTVLKDLGVLLNSVADQAEKY